MNNQSNDDLLGAYSVNGFLEAYKIGRTSFYRLIKDEKLRAVKVGKRTLILRRDADAWLRSLPAVSA